MCTDGTAKLFPTVAPVGVAEYVSDQYECSSNLRRNESPSWSLTVNQNVLGADSHTTAITLPSVKQQR
jgi:hypothetical protein